MADEADLAFDLIELALEVLTKRLGMLKMRHFHINQKREDMYMLKIQLPKGKFAQIDDDDMALISPYKWRVRKCDNHFYAVAWTPRPNRKSIYMHRLICGALSGEMIDHIDGDGLNNQRSTNLRKCTNQQNAFNRTVRQGRKFKGIYLCKRTKKWGSCIVVNGHTKFLGRFETQKEAAKMYNLAAIKYFGEFSRLNNI